MGIAETLLRLAAVARSCSAFVVVSKRSYQRACNTWGQEAGTNRWDNERADQGVCINNRLGHSGSIRTIRHVEFGGHQLVRQRYQTISCRWRIENIEQLLRHIKNRSQH